MNRLQLLLIKLAEESTEVGKIALKTAQFGPDEICPGQPFTNYELMRQEINDLIAAVEMLNEEYGLNFQLNHLQIEAKKDKVNEFATKSESLGMVTPTVDLRDEKSQRMSAVLDAVATIKTPRR